VLLAALVAVVPVLSYPAASAEMAPRSATRTVETSYHAPGGVYAPGAAPVLTSAGAAQESKAPESSVRVTATDDAGRPVAIDVEYQAKGDPVASWRVWCGTSPTLAIAAGSSVRVTPVAGACNDGSLSTPTSGRISLAFVRPLSPATIGPADRWALLVGIQDYAGNTHSTYGARGDVSAIRTALLRSGWRSDHIRTVQDGQATGQGILDAMAWLAERSGPQTFSLFHFSGHVCVASRGPCGADHAYLWSYDNRFLPETSVGAVLGQVQGRAWFDFAGCESGAFDVGLSSSARLFTGSSQASETSYEQPAWKQSVWSGLVWDQAFLKGGAGPQPGRATIGQMVAYGKAQAPKVTANQEAGPQHPYVAGGDPSQSLYAPRQ